MQVGLPLFFHLAGRVRGLSTPCSMWDFARKRFVRLILPVPVAYVFLVVPFYQFAVRDDHAPGHFLWWLMWFIEGNYKFTLQWIWYLPALFATEMAALPVIFFAQEPTSPRYVAMVGALTIVSAAVLVQIGFNPCLVASLFLGPVTAMRLATWVPFTPRNNDDWVPESWLARATVSIAQIVSHVGIVTSFAYQDLGAMVGGNAALTKMLTYLPQCVMLFGFYTQGYFFQRWSHCPTWGKTRALSRTDLDSVESKLWDLANGQHMRTAARFAEMLMCFVIVLLVSIGSPGAAHEEWLFPVFSASYKNTSAYGAFNVIGSWGWIAMLEHAFMSVADGKFNARCHQHVVASSFMVYVLAPAIAYPFVYWVIRDGGLIGGLWQVTTPLLVTAVSVSCSLTIYAVVCRSR